MLASTGMLMLNMDSPQHTAQRRVVQRAFTPRVIRDLEVRLKDIAAELPLLAICELIGIPAEDRDKIFDWTNRLIGFDDPELTSSQEDGELAMMEMYVYSAGLAEQRAAEPTSDIISLLLQSDFN